MGFEPLRTRSTFSGNAGAALGDKQEGRREEGKRRGELIAGVEWWGDIRDRGDTHMPRCLEE